MESNHGPITFRTKETDSGPRKWEAWIDQRHCVWMGDTEEEALSNLINGVAQLAADGKINPRFPEEPGPITADPVQQCIDILSRKLKHASNEAAEAIGRTRTDGPNWEVNAKHAEARRQLQEARRVIGNVGTALAALCRIESD